MCVKMNIKIMGKVMEKGQILGFDIDLLTFENALLVVNKALEKDEGLHIVTINPEIIMNALKNKDLERAIKGADLVIPDGVGIKVAFKIKGIEQEQIPGIDFAKKILERCVQMQYSVGFLGAKEEVLQATVDNLQKNYQKIKISYQRNGFFNEEDEEAIVERIKSTDTKVLFVALGSPKQDLFIEKYKEQLNNVVMIGVGGTFDVWSNKVKRAPKIFQKFGCEWLYRTLKQPSRIKRIFPALPLFVFKVIMEKGKSKN